MKSDPPQLHNEDTDELLTIAEAKKRLRISKSTLYRLKNANMIEMIFVGSRRKITERSVNRYLNQQLKAGMETGENAARG